MFPAKHENEQLSGIGSDCNERRKKQSIKTGRTLVVSAFPLPHCCLWLSFIVIVARRRLGGAALILLFAGIFLVWYWYCRFGRRRRCSFSVVVASSSSAGGFEFVDSFRLGRGGLVARCAMQILPVVRSKEGKI